MEKIQSSFLWGDTNQSCKPYLVGWYICCIPMNEGDLGIKRPHHMNDAFLLKMLWNLFTEPDDLWCKVLYSKYGRNKDLRVTIDSISYDSPLWKALTGIGNNFSKILCGSWALVTILIFGWINELLMELLLYPLLIKLLLTQLSM